MDVIHPWKSMMNCGVGEDFWESLGLQGDPTSPSKRRLFWVFIGRNDVEGETPILRPPESKSWFIGKAPDAGKDWRQEEKGMTEAEMVGWHEWLNGHEFEQAPAGDEGQGSLVWCSPWGRKELDRTEQLNNNNNKWTYVQNRNRLIDLEKGLMVTRGERGEGKGWLGSLKSTCHVLLYWAGIETQT